MRFTRLFVAAAMASVSAVAWLIRAQDWTNTIDAQRQQCFCNGRYVEVSRGTNCRDYCGGGSSGDGRGPAPVVVDPVDELRNALSPNEQWLLDQLTPEERVSLDAVMAAVDRRRGQAWRENDSLRQQLSSLEVSIEKFHAEHAELIFGNVKMAGEIASLEKIVAKLQRDYDALQPKLERLPKVREEMCDETRRIAARARAKRTAFWQTFASIIAPNQPAEPVKYMRRIEAPGYVTLRRSANKTSVAVAPFAAANDAQSPIALPEPISAGPIAAAANGPETPALKLASWAAAHQHGIRLRFDLEAASTEQTKLIASIDAAKRSKGDLNGRQSELADQRSQLSASLDYAWRSLRDGLGAARVEFQALWRTAKEELFWNEAYDAIQRVATLTVGRGEALVATMDKVMSRADKLLSALPVAVSDAASTESYPQSIQAYTMSMIALYPDTAAIQRDPKVTEPRNWYEWGILQEARDGAGQRIERVTMTDPFWHEDMGFVKKAFPFTKEEWKRFPNARQLHYVENVFTGWRGDFRFPD